MSLALVAGLNRARRSRDAAAALRRLLQTSGLDVLGPLAALGETLAAHVGMPGWIGWRKGRLILGSATLSPQDVAVFVAGKKLGLRWTEEQPRVWSAPCAATGVVRTVPELLGAPIRPARFRAVEGVVTRTADGVRGWAWHPHEPSREPELILELAGSAHSIPLRPAARAQIFSSNQPFVTPWTFELPVAPDLGPVRVLARGTGRDLLGSPCPPVANDLAPPPIVPIGPSTGVAMVAVADSRCSDAAGLGAVWNIAARRAPTADLLVIADARLWPGALEALRAAAGTGLAIPFGNAGGVGGYPQAGETVPLDSAEAQAIANTALALSAAPVALDPAWVRPGDVLFVSRTCVNAVGGFAEGRFLSARATLTEFCARATRRGFPLALAPSAFAWSAEPARRPAFLAETIEAHDKTALSALGVPPHREAGSTAAARARFALDSARAEAALAGRACTLLITHDEGGGIERHVQDRVRAVRNGGAKALVLRSQRLDPEVIRLEVSPHHLPNLEFRLPKDRDRLLATLRRINIVRIEIHQLRRHPAMVRELPWLLRVPYEVMLHDYALLCPRVTLVGRSGAYCGEPGLAQCETCAAAYVDTPHVAPAGVAGLRAATAQLLNQADRVYAPSEDVRQRFTRYWPLPRYEVRRWEDRRRAPGNRRDKQDPATVCVVGSINEVKGFDVLLACARDARVRGLPLRFTVVGRTRDDTALIEAGCFVTGPFREAERARLIERQQAAAGFLPSIWPETWCYSLTGLLAAGLPTLCFDIGAQAERVRAAGGLVLPLGSSERGINDALLRLIVV